jgi:hypothetical protein
MNLTRKNTLGSPGRILMARNMALASGSLFALSAKTRAISGMAGEASGVPSNAIAVAASITNNPCVLICLEGGGPGESAVKMCSSLAPLSLAKLSYFW